MFLRPHIFKHFGHHIQSKEASSSAAISGISDSGNKTILTLCGGEGRAKQLFSSLAKPDGSGRNLADVPLPNGISTTNVVPVHSLGENQEKIPTLGEAFPPPASLKPLNPPKPTSRHTSTRSTSINWHNPLEAVTTTKESSPRDPYWKQTLPTGRWLTYNVAPSTEQMTSPGSKRRHRDRALSTGEPQSAIDAETSAAHAQAKDDALFRSVYSSFAPTRDDYNAIVSQEQKNRIWWSKYGEARFHDALTIREEALHGPLTSGPYFEPEEIDEKLIEEAVESWDTLPNDIDMEDRPRADPRTNEDLLEEISELLEILNSHQRIRSLSQPAATRPPSAHRDQLSTAPLDNSTPSSAELEVYENLKAQLISLISTLPPYLLSKVDGDKLAALKVTSRIKIPGKYQRGALQEETQSTKPRSSTNTYPSYPAASSLRGPYTTTPNQQYSQRPAYNQTPVQRPTPASSYSNYSARPPSASQYTGGATRPGYGQYPQQRASSYVDRFTNGQLGHQASQYSQYSNSYRPQLGQHTPSFSQQFSTPQGRAASASMPGTQQPYQPRNLGTPGGYNFNTAGGQSGASPGQQQQQHSSVFGSQGLAAGQRPTLYQQHSSHYGGSRSPAEKGQINGVAGGIDGGQGQARMSPAIEQQRAGSLEGKRQQGSVTPQPLASGQTSRQNGTPAPPTAQQNGVTA